jgi:hypothetical protein
VLCQPPDLGRIADEYAVAESLDECNELHAVPAGFEPDDDLAGEARIEAADVIPLKIQLGELNRPVSSIAVANSLLTCVKGDSTIDSHGTSFAVSCAN